MRAKLMALALAVFAPPGAHAQAYACPISVAPADVATLDMDCLLQHIHVEDDPLEVTRVVSTEGLDSLQIDGPTAVRVELLSTENRTTGNWVVGLMVLTQGPTRISPVQINFGAPLRVTKLMDLATDPSCPLPSCRYTETAAAILTAADIQHILSGPEEMAFRVVGSGYLRVDGVFSRKLFEALVFRAGRAKEFRMQTRMPAGWKPLPEPTPSERRQGFRNAP